MDSACLGGIFVITITEKAAEKIKSLTQGDFEKGLRIKIVGGGCSGLHYQMEIGAPTEKDKVFEGHGAKVIVDKKSFLYLVKSQVDYHDSFVSSGFVITNPNAKRTCGCGESFNV